MRPPSYGVCPPTPRQHGIFTTREASRRGDPTAAAAVAALVPCSKKLVLLFNPSTDVVPSRKRRLPEVQLRHGPLVGDA
jgi:hypothetical protein